MVLSEQKLDRLFPSKLLMMSPEQIELHNSIERQHWILLKILIRYNPNEYEQPCWYNSP